MHWRKYKTHILNPRLASILQTTISPEPTLFLHEEFNGAKQIRSRRVLLARLSIKLLKIEASSTASQLRPATIYFKKSRFTSKHRQKEKYRDFLKLLTKSTKKSNQITCGIHKLFEISLQKAQFQDRENGLLTRQCRYSEPSHLSRRLCPR